MENGIVQMILLVAFVFLIFIGGRVSWRFYQKTDDLNRRLIRLFVVGLCLIPVIGLLGVFDVLPKQGLYYVMAGAGIVGYGALCVLIAREIWAVFQKIRILKAFRVLEEQEE